MPSLVFKASSWQGGEAGCMYVHQARVRPQRWRITAVAFRGKLLWCMAPKMVGPTALASRLTAAAGGCEADASNPFSTFNLFAAASSDCAAALESQLLFVPVSGQDERVTLFCFSFTWRLDQEHTHALYTLLWKVADGRSHTVLFRISVSFYWILLDLSSCGVCHIVVESV